MNKETISYVRHIMGSDFVQLDFLNAILAIAIIVVSLIAFVSGNTMFFGVSFILGDVLVLFNMIKCIMKKSVMGVIVFLGVFIALASIVLYIYEYLM